MQLNGQAAIVTGGASGLGGATAAFLAQAGAKVTIFDMNAELGEESRARRVGEREAGVHQGLRQEAPDLCSHPNFWPTPASPISAVSLPIFASQC